MTHTADPIAQFAQEVNQGHREAFAALRQILAAALQLVTPQPAPPVGPGSNPPPTPPSPRALSIALKAAMAVLRTRPPEVETDEEPEKPFRPPPRPLTHDDVLLIAASQRGGRRFLPIQLIPRLKAWQEYADAMGFPPPFDYPRELLNKLRFNPEKPPQDRKPGVENELIPLEPQPAPAPST